MDYGLDFRSLRDWIPYLRLKKTFFPRQEKKCLGVTLAEPDRFFLPGCLYFYVPLTDLFLALCLYYLYTLNCWCIYCFLNGSRLPSKEKYRSLFSKFRIIWSFFMLQFYLRSQTFAFWSSTDLEQRAVWVWGTFFIWFNNNNKQQFIKVFPYLCMALPNNYR